MWQMLQQDAPGDYVIATGRPTSVKAFCDLAFAHVGLVAGEHVVVDPKFMRPAEVDVLHGDATKAKQKFGWSAEIRLEQLVAEMVDADLVRLGNKERL
jgi:GDPmannose 4,6-dehydratase